MTTSAKFIEIRPRDDGEWRVYITPSLEAELPQLGEVYDTDGTSLLGPWGDTFWPSAHEAAAWLARMLAPPAPPAPPAPLNPWGSDDEFPVEAWRAQVNAGATRLGYGDWVDQQTRAATKPGGYRYTIEVFRDVEEDDPTPHGDRTPPAQMAAELQQGWEEAGIAGFFKIVNRQPCSWSEWDAIQPMDGSGGGW